MASPGRTLAWPILGVVLLMLVAACSGQGADRSATCDALDLLGAEIASYQELLVWPGVTAASLQEATDDLEAAVVGIANVTDDASAIAIAEAFVLVSDAFRSTIPASLVELRPGEPAQMAAAFISVELQPLVDAHAAALEESC